jgi:hypothetical protein
MKHLLLVVLLSHILFNLSAQEKPIIKFKANETADVIIGKEWNFEYEQMKWPLNVEFYGTKLKLFYDDGKIYSEDTVLSFDKKEKNDYDKKTGEIYSLKINNDNMIQYIIIEKRLISESWMYVIKIPNFDKNKEFFSYRYYELLEE